MKLILLVVVAAVIAIACTPERSFPSYPNVADSSSSHELVTTAPAPGGSAYGARYWLYGSEGEFSDLKRELSTNYLQHNWRILDPDLSGEIRFIDQAEQRCISYFDFRRSDPTHEYVLYDLARSHKETSKYKALVLVVVHEGCG